jgi:hypothetical protein
MKDCASPDVSRHGGVRDPDTVHLNGQFDGNSFVSQVSRHAEHGPAARAVTDKDHSGRMKNLTLGERTGMRRKVRQDPIAPRRPGNGNERLGANIAIPRSPKNVADLHDPGVLVVGSLHRPHKSGVDNFAVGRLSDPISRGWPPRGRRMRRAKNESRGKDNPRKQGQRANGNAPGPTRDCPHKFPFRPGYLNQRNLSCRGSGRWDAGTALSEIPTCGAGSTAVSSSRLIEERPKQTTEALVSFL